MDVAAYAYNVVQDRFGADGVPPENELHKLVDPMSVSQIFSKAGGNKRVTPKAVRDAYCKQAIEEGTRRLAENKMRQIIDARGGGDVVVLSKHVNMRHPEILRDILKAKTPAAAGAAFDKYAQTVEADFERLQICNREIRGFNFKVQNAFAQRKTSTTRWRPSRGRWTMR